MESNGNQQNNKKETSCSTSVERSPSSPKLPADGASNSNTSLDNTPQPGTSKTDKRRHNSEGEHYSIECITQYNKSLKTRRTGENDCVASKDMNKATDLPETAEETAVDAEMSAAEEDDVDSYRPVETSVTMNGVVDREEIDGPEQVQDTRMSSDDELNINFVPAGMIDDDEMTRDSTTTNEDNADEGPVTEEDAKKYDPTPSNPPPKHSWKLPRELQLREIGGLPGLKERFHRRFIVRTYGSLHTVERFELMSKLSIHRGCVNSLNFNETGTLLASGSDDLYCAIYQWQDEHLWAHFDTGHRSNVFQTKFLRNTDDLKLVTAARDGQVRLAELRPNGSVAGTKRIAYHKSPCHKLTLDPLCDSIVLSCGEDGHVLQVDLRAPSSQNLVSVYHENRRIPLYTVHIHPLQPAEFAVGGRDQFVRVFDRRFLSSESTSAGGASENSSRVRAEPLKKYCPRHLVAGDKKCRPNVSCLVYNYNGSEIHCFL